MDTESQKEILKEHLEVPFNEMLKTIPGLVGIRLGEEPTYTLMKSEGVFEIRKYDPMTVASVIIRGEYEAALEEGFIKLADYIFGKNTQEYQVRTNSSLIKEKQSAQLPMTAPVIHERAEMGWKVTFVLPREYTLKNAPKPLDPAITLTREPSRIMACMKYSGTNTLQAIEHRHQQLLDWLQTTDFRTCSQVRCAEYDGPLTVPFLRRNEVQVRVERVYHVH